MTTLNVNTKINITEYVVEEDYCMYDITIKEFIHSNHYYGLTTVKRLDSFKEAPTAKKLFSLPIGSQPSFKSILIKKGSLLPLQQAPNEVDAFMYYDEINEEEMEEGLVLYNNDFLMCEKYSIEEIKTGMYELYHVEVDTLSIFNLKEECVYFPVYSKNLEVLQSLEPKELAQKYNKAWQLAASQVGDKGKERGDYLKKIYRNAEGIFIESI